MKMGHLNPSLPRGRGGAPASLTCVYKQTGLWNSFAGRVSGEMADARALGARGAIRAGSSPVSPTIRFLLLLLLHFLFHILQRRIFVIRID